jgi:hypothetical protein
MAGLYRVCHWHAADRRSNQILYAQTSRMKSAGWLMVSFAFAHHQPAKGMVLF